MATNDGTHTVNAIQLVDALSYTIEERMPTFVWGASGIGKTDIIGQVADALDMRLVLPPRAVQMDPVDVRGIPHPRMDEQVAEWLRPDWLPDPNDDRPTIVFIDELPGGTPSTQGALHQVFLPPHRLGSYQANRNTRFVAAGNRASDHAHVHKMSSPLANLMVHLLLIAELDPWLKWAAANGVRPEVLAFMRLHPGMLHDFDPKVDLHRFPTPRSITRASRILDAELPSEIESALIAGTVGDAWAAQFRGFRRYWDELPDPDHVLNNPSTAPVPDDQSVLWAFSAMLAARATPQNIDNVWVYAQRMTHEYTVATMMDAINRDERLRETAAYAAFAAGNPSEI